MLREAKRFFFPFFFFYFTKLNPATFVGIKYMVDHFFLIKMKIFALKMITNWLLTFLYMNASIWLDQKLTCVWRLNVSWAFLLSSEIFVKFNCVCCFRFNWDGHRGMLPRGHCMVNSCKLVQSTGGTQARNQDFMRGGANEAKVDQTIAIFPLFPRNAWYSG